MTDRPDLVDREAPQIDAAPAPAGRPALRAIILGSVLVGVTVAVYASPIRLWLQDVDEVHHAITSLGVWGYPACILAVAILVGCGVPRLIFCALAGMIFGFWRGLVLVEAATLLGYYAAFLFVRWGGSGWVTHRRPRLRKWADLLHDQGVAGVLLLRLLPIHGTLVNLCLGLSRVKHRHFLIGTVIGVIPEAIPTTLVGAGLVKTSLSHSIQYLTIASVALVLVWIACGYTLRFMRSSRSGSMLMAQAAAMKGAGDE